MDSAEDLEDRFVDLESKIAFQERSITVLNETVREQQTQLRKLENQFESLVKELRGRFAEDGESHEPGIGAR